MRARLLFLLLPLVLGWAGTPLLRAEEPVPSFEDLQKAFGSALGSNDPAVRGRAFEVLLPCRDVRVVQLIVKTVDRIRGDQEKIRQDQKGVEGSYEKEVDRQEKAIAWFENSGKSSKELDRYNTAVRKIRIRMEALQAKSRHLEDEYSRTYSLFDSGVRVLGEIIQNLDTDSLNQALAVLDEQWLGSKDISNQMRWLDALSKVDRPTIALRIRKVVLDPTRTEELRAAALDTLAARKEAATLELALPFLQAGADDWDLTEAAIHALKRLHLRGGIAPLIDFLKRDDIGRLRDDAHEALHSLTGQKHGPYYDPWHKWWEDEKDRFQMPPEPVPETVGEKPPPGTTFYGIHSFSKRVLFILDLSGSMDQTPGHDRTKPAKFDVAKRQLLGYLDSLNDGDHFDVIFFNHEVMPWQPKMVEVSESTRRMAHKFIEKMKPLGGTNIYDALEAGFAMALRATGEPLVDTIFFLTDGRPVGGKVQRPEQILADVRQWNRTARLTIHCVGVGSEDQIDEAFLKALARIGHGQYRHYE